MQYQKLISGDTIIEFRKNWANQEIISINGNVLSEKPASLTNNHYFSIIENDHKVHYVLTTKLDYNMQVVLDLSKNGELIQENVPLQFGEMPDKPYNRHKKEGLKKLEEYELDEALAAFAKALKIAPGDPEIYFHMACAYSVLEKPLEGFFCIKKAIENNFQDEELISTHDMLAFIRIQEAFENFKNSGYRRY